MPRLPFDAIDLLIVDRMGNFDTDREAIELALVSVCVADTAAARVVRIADTLSLERMEVSEAYARELSQRPQIEPLTAPRR